MLDLLRRPDLALRLLAVLLSAVPIGMLPLALVVDGLDRSGRTDVAGVLAGALALGSAVGVLAQGALLVRVRAALLLPLSGLAGVVSSLVVATAAPSGGGLALTAVAAGVTGATIPAVTTAVRGRLVEVLPEGGMRVRAYAALNVLFQAGLALGPVAAAVLAAAGLARAAAPIAALLGLVAAGVAAVVDRAAPTAAAVRMPSSGGRSAPLGLAVLLAGAGAAGFGMGSLQVIVPSTAVGMPVLAGAAFAALALGEVAGALLVARRVVQRTAPAALRAGLAAMAVVYAIAAAGLPGAGAVVLTAALGLATAVQSIGAAVLLDRVVRPHLVTAAFAAQVSTMLVGTAAGAAVAGAAGSPSALLVPAVLLVVVLLLSVLGRGSLAAVPRAASGTGARRRAAVRSRAQGTA